MTDNEAWLAGWDDGLILKIYPDWYLLEKYGKYEPLYHDAWWQAQEVEHDDHNV